MSSPNFAALDGERFEELCEDLFKAMGFDDPPPERSGRGPDGGRDLIVTEWRSSLMTAGRRPFRWLVQCKNFAKSNKSVQPQNVGSILDKISRHKADGYLLVTSTIPSTDVESDIKAIHEDPRFPFEATYWARPNLIDAIRQYRNVYQKYFGLVNGVDIGVVHWSRRNPFLELYSYDEAHAAYFFGRQTEIDLIVEKAYRESIILLFGESGVGKTSLVQAGILPVLRTEGVRIINLIAKPDFAEDDFLKVLTVEFKDSEIYEELKSTKSFTEGFRHIAAWLRAHEQRLILIVDRFEAILLGTDESSSQLGKALQVAVSIAKQYDCTSFLFCLRSDYLDKLGVWAMNNRIPDIWSNSIPVQKLTKQQATDVLHHAPAIVNAQLSEETIRQVIGDLEKLDEGKVHPANLQIIASKLFETARSRTDPKTSKLLIEMGDYDAVGGSDGVINEFLQNKLASFGEESERARSILLELVSATGRRLALSTHALSNQLSVDVHVLARILAKLSELRLVKPTDQPDVFELVHDLLAARILSATPEQQKRVKAVKEAFALALSTWEAEHVLESGERLDWFYQNRASLSIGVDELWFVLLCEAPIRVKDIFGSARKFSATVSGTRRRKWINSAEPSVCLQTLDRVFEALQNRDINGESAFELITDFCSASNFEVQRELVLRIDKFSNHPRSSLYINAYRSSPIPTQATLSFLLEFARGDIEFELAKVVVFRLLEYYRGTFPNSTLPGQKSKDIENWIGRFPLQLLDRPMVRDSVFYYLRLLQDALSEKNPTLYSERRDITEFKLELLKLIYGYDPNRTINALWGMIKMNGYIGNEEQRILQILRVYDPERTISEVVRVISKLDHYSSESTLSFLESLEAPETDELVVSDLKRYAEKFVGGSKRWHGRSLRYWRKAVHRAVLVASRRKLAGAVPYLNKIALRSEPENLKLASLDALAAIDGNEAIPTFVGLLASPSAVMRRRAMKHLIDINQPKAIVQEIMRVNIQEPRDLPMTARTQKKEVVISKIKFLRRMGEPQAISILTQWAEECREEDVKKLALRAISFLKKNV